MSLRQLFPLVTVLAVLGNACQERKASDSADTSGAGVRATAAAAKAGKGFEMPVATAGHLTLADAEVFFLPCGRTGDPQKVDDQTGGEAMKMLRTATKTKDGLITVVRLDGNRLVQVCFASTERMTCKDLPSNATVEASGNEPFWGVKVEGTAATYRTPYNMQGIVYQGGTWTRIDSTH